MMFKKTLILAICIQLFLAPNVFGAENFYARLDIKETKSGAQILFSLNKASALYGDYDQAFKIYGGGNLDKTAYIIETYDSGKKIQEKYEIRSSRFVYWDGEESGGVQETDSGMIAAVIPFDRQNPTAFIKIDNSGVKTGFISLPASQLEEEFKKIPLCKKENEVVKGEERCCAGLVTVSKDENTYVCINCGDGKCSVNESYASCYQDCPIAGSPSVSPSPIIQTPEAVKSNSLVLTIVLSIIVLILLAFLAFKAIKSARGGI